MITFFAIHRWKQMPMRLAARTIGSRPVKAFLEQALALAEGENWDAKRRLEVLRRFQLRKISDFDDGTRVR